MAIIKLITFKKTIGIEEKVKHDSTIANTLTVVNQKQ